MDGILIVNKEAGFTSHDVVAKLRGILHQKKIGHTGTLDPQAQGVLPVCVGKATKVCSILTDTGKEYEAVLLFGKTTDTQDAEGKVLSVCDEKLPELTEEKVRAIIESFIGKSEQIPPMYSAKKVGGKKLYELAREGIEVERKPSEIEIFSITIKEMNLPRVRFSVQCSKGTYIRTLCHDIGQKAGCGAIMESLLRTRSGRFSLQEAKKLSEIQMLQEEGGLEDVLIPVDRIFETYPKAVVKEAHLVAVANGNRLQRDWILIEQPETVQDGEELYRIYDVEGKFYGLYEAANEPEYLKPRQMFL